MACTTTDQCMGTGFVCRAGTCSCTADVPDVCGTGAEGACVNKKSDPDHCGDCATKCDAGATCVDSKCTTKPVDVLAAGTGCGAIRLAVSGTNLYWVEAMSKKVRTVPLAGGAATDVVTDTGTPMRIAADAKGIYWISKNGKVSSVMKKALPLAAGAAEELVKFDATDETNEDKQEILGIAVGADKLYYTLGNEVHQISTTKGGADIIVGIAVNYDAPAKIEGVPHGVAVNETMLAWTDQGDRNGVEGDDILVESATPLTDKSGYVELAQSVGGLGYEIAVDATYAYWTDGGRFVRNKLTAATPVPDPAIMESPKSSVIQSFAITAMNVYAANADGLILRHSLTPPAEGMEPVEPAAIARDQKVPTSVVVNGTKVYWATEDCAIRSTEQ